MNYCIIKREKCIQCSGTGFVPATDEEVRVRIDAARFLDETHAVVPTQFRCDCVNGYTETRIDADEWILAKMKEFGVANVLGGVGV